MYRQLNVQLCWVSCRYLKGHIHCATMLTRPRSISVIHIFKVKLTELNSKVVMCLLEYTYATLNDAYLSLIIETTTFYSNKERVFFFLKPLVSEQQIPCTKGTIQNNQTRTYLEKSDSKLVLTEVEPGTPHPPLTMQTVRPFNFVIARNAD